MVQETKQIATTEAERYMLVYMISVLLIVTTLVIVFFIVFQKRKNKILLDKLRQQRMFEEELTKTQIEIQEQTLKNVGRELHDNIGQMLAYSNMQINALGAVVKEEIKPKVDAVQSVINDSIEEVRALSKTLNSDVSLSIGLLESLNNEVQRINKLKTITAKISEPEISIEIDNKKHEIFIYRIAQEFLSNSLKYSEAKLISVDLNNSEENLIVEISDDGKGFEKDSVKKGSGLINMQNRAELIGASLKLNSEINKGTYMCLIYPLKQD